MYINTELANRLQEADGIRVGMSYVVGADALHMGGLYVEWASLTPLARKILHAVIGRIVDAAGLTFAFSLSVDIAKNLSTLKDVFTHS